MKRKARILWAYYYYFQATTRKKCVDKSVSDIEVIYKIFQYIK